MPHLVPIFIYIYLLLPLLLLAYQTAAQTQTHTQRFGDGCEHIFLDLGSNAGVQIRKLYEPHKYSIAKSQLLQIFAANFGDNRATSVCAFSFEPNPLHFPRLREMAAVYQSLGWRYTTATTTTDTTTTTELLLLLLLILLQQQQLLLLLQLLGIPTLSSP
jgi:hypothetical protein